MRKAQLSRINWPAFDSILLALIQIVTYVANIATTKILSVKLSLTEYGTYSTVNSVITIAASFTLFGLGDSINYYYNKKNEESSENKIEYINTIFFVQLLIGVFVGMVLIFASASIANYYNNSLVKPLILIVCLKPWISNATHLYQVLFVSSNKAKLIAIRNLIVSILKVILLYLSVQLFDGLIATFVCLVLLDLMQLIAFKYIFGKTNFKVEVFSFGKEKLLPVIKYTVPMGVYFVTTTLMREIEKLVIGGLGTTEEYAIYANCAKTLPLNILITAFATVLIPYIMKSVSGKEYDRVVDILRKYLSIGYLSVWMFSGALLLCSSEAIQFFYTEEYVVGLPIFVVYIIDGMIQFASVHLVIAANGDSKFLMKVSIFLLGINALLSFIFYKVFALFGNAMLGPAIATVLVSLFYVAALHLKASKILGVKISDFLPIKSMGVYLVELLSVGVVFYFVKCGMYLMNLYWVVVLIALCVAYCLTVGLINIKLYKKLFADINRLKCS